MQKRRVNIQVLGGVELDTAVERVASAMTQGRISGEGSTTAGCLPLRMAS